MNQLELEDRERFEFLQRLDAAPFEVTDWEAKFIGSILSTRARQEAHAKKCKSTPWPVQFSAAQRNSIDQMRKSYGGRL